MLTVKRLNEKAEIGREYRWNHSSYRNGIHFVCAIYNGCNVVLSIEISYVSVSAILYSILKIKSLMIPF